MATLIICILMWVLVAVLVIFRRTNRERSVLYAAFAITASTMFADDVLYTFVDGLLGGRDIAHLVSSLLLMVGFYFFARAIAKAGPQPHIVARRATLIVALAIVTVSFFLAPHPGGSTSTTNFILTLGHTPAVAVYTWAQYGYLALVAGTMAVAAVATINGNPVRRERVASEILLLGSSLCIALSLVVIVLGFAQLYQWERVVRNAAILYYPLQVATFLFLCIGLSTAPVVRQIAQNRHAQRVELYLEKVTPLWREAVVARPSLRLERRSTPPEQRLHRRIVEIRDSAMDPRNDFTLDEEQRHLLRAAEDHLLDGSAAD